MKDVLFIGPYRQNDGWGEGAKDYVKCLNNADINLAIRPIYMSNSIEKGSIDDFISLENKFLNKRPDVVIQNVLPNILDYQYGCKNIGVFYLENSTIKPTGWVSHINLIDEVWVSSEFEKTTLINSGVTTPINIVPMPYDFSKAEKEYDDIAIPELKGNYVFYFIGEYTDRKNISALVKAFHLEFRHADNVSLVIKTNTSMPGFDTDMLTQKVVEDINKIKANMRLYMHPTMYIPEFIVCSRLSEDDLFSLHKTGNCFVMPSKGESLNRPLMDAVAMGNQVVYTSGTGMDEVAPHGLQVKSHEAPTITGTSPIRTLYTSHETWKEVDIQDLRRQMRQAYEDSDGYPELDREHLKKNFSYKAVSNRINELLC